MSATSLAQRLQQLKRLRKKRPKEKCPRKNVHTRRKTSRHFNCKEERHPEKLSDFTFKVACCIATIRYFQVCALV